MATTATIQTETLNSIYQTTDTAAQGPNEKAEAGPENITVSGSENVAPTKSPTPRLKFILILVALYATVFLVALDRTILATAAPYITSHFHSLDDISWYASAYLITSCATQPLWGRIYTFHSTKVIFMIAILVFEVGSIVCAAAPSSTAFIVGRAIAGLGSGGIFAGATVILTFMIPLPKRPKYVSILGSMFGVASILGPLLGGAFTDNVTWRWCFYINLPIGGAALAIVMPFLQVNDQKNKPATFTQQLMRLDPIGQLFLMPSIVCLLVAMQWGGSTYTWRNHRVIALFVVFSILLVAFIGVQVWKQDDATLPPRIMKQRSLAMGALFAFCLGGGLISMLYSIAIWFQAVKGTSAVQSGIDSLATVLALVVGTILSGTVVEKTGYYVPWMINASIFMSIGAGLITTFRVSTGHAMWIGYQVLFGLGLGIGMQQPSLAAQTVLNGQDVSMGVSLMFFGQSLGGAIFVAIAQAIFNSFLGQGLHGISGVHVQSVVDSGATGLAGHVPAFALEAVLKVYNSALVNSFYVPLAGSCLMMIPALGMEWRTIKTDVGVVEVN